MIATTHQHNDQVNQKSLAVFINKSFPVIQSYKILRRILLATRKLEGHPKDDSEKKKKAKLKLLEPLTKEDDVKHKGKMFFPVHCGLIKN